MGEILLTLIPVKGKARRARHCRPRTLVESRGEAFEREWLRLFDVYLKAYRDKTHPVPRMYVDLYRGDPEQTIYSFVQLKAGL